MQQFNDGFTCFHIQISGWFIRQDDSRRIEYGTCNHNALLFATGKFVRKFITFVGHSHQLKHVHAKPELETAGWLPRLPIEDLVYFDQWGQRDDQQPLIAHLQRDQAAAQRGRQATPA